MKRCASAMLAAALIVLMIPVAGLAQMAYVQDFEALAPVDGSLAADGWLVYGNIFDPAWNWLYGHGPWPAPNNIGNWCDIVTGQGGPEQGLQQLVVYSDYANGDHGAGLWIESNLFQEQTIVVGATGVWTFAFDAKMGDLGGISTALAFIKTLDPNAGWATTNFITADMTYIPATWAGYTLSIDVTGLDAQILQIGFSSMATLYEPCGVFYDNINFGPEGSSPVESTTWGALKSTYR